MRSKIATSGRITILLGKQQAETGERTSPRKLAEKAGVPKDFVYRLDAGTARHVDLQALARLCEALNCIGRLTFSRAVRKGIRLSAW